MKVAKSGKLIWLFPLLLVSYEVAIYLSNDAYLPALPLIKQDLHTNDHLVQLTLTTWFIGSGLLQLFVGPLTDRIGRRSVLLASGVIFVLSSIGCALTQDIYCLLILRLLQGATIGAMIVPGYATIHELFEQKQAIHTLALMSGVTILAPAFGPFVGVLVLYIADWRWIFGGLAIGAFLLIIGLFFNMPETKPVATEKVPFRQVIATYKKIFGNKSFMLYIIIAQCFFAAMIAWIAAGPFLLISHFHFTTLFFGIAQAVIFVSFIIGTRLIKIWLEKLTPQEIVKKSTILLVIGAVYALCTSLLWPTIIWNMLVAMILLALSAGLAFPVLNRLAIEASSEPMGSRVAVSTVFMGVSSTVASAAVSLIFNNTLVSLAIILVILSVFPSFVILKSWLFKCS